MNNDKMPSLPKFIRRDVERAIEDAIHPKGMSVHDGKALIGADRLQYMLNLIDRAALSTHGQESEAQAIAIVDAIEVDPSKRTIKCLSYERLLGISAGTKLYTAPPSALAIDASAKRQAAEVLEGWAETAEAFGFDGDAKNYRDIKAEILATIPQDGITALEEFGMKVAREAMRVGRTTYFSSSELAADDSLRAIVSSLIGEKP